MDPQILTAIGFVLAAIAATVAFILSVIGNKRTERHREEIRQLVAAHQEAMQRQKITQRSVHVGAAAETFATWLPNFPVLPTEARHISGGSPIDYIGFRGLEDEDGEITIVFIEVKSGKTWRGKQLTPRERRVQEAVQQARVEWVVYYPPRADDPGSQSSQPGQSGRTGKYKDLPPVPPRLLRNPSEEK